MTKHSAFYMAMSRWLVLSAGVLAANLAWSAPAIQSVSLAPNPLVAGQRFSINVVGSMDVTRATATLDFRPTTPRLLRIPLQKQAFSWIGTGTIPLDGDLLGGNDAEVAVKVIVQDSTRQRTETVVRLNVTLPFNTALFSGGVLTITGDDLDNVLIVTRDIAGRLLLNNGAIPITGGIATVDNTSLIRIFGLGGNDILTINENNGPLPPANLFGGDDDDTLTGGQGGDLLDGGPGNDALFGRAGNDRLVGGLGNDRLTGGQGVDVIGGGDGDDQITWAPGDGSDVVEGDSGMDTLAFVSGNGSEIFDLSANGERLRFFRSLADVLLDCGGVERLLIRPAGGADVLTVNDLSGTDVTEITVDLSGGTDGVTDTVIITGSNGDDHFTVSSTESGATVAGLAATLKVVGAEGGQDELLLKGGGGTDSVDFEGSSRTDVVEFVDFSANDRFLRFSSNLGGMRTDCENFERAGFRALDGADQVQVNDLSGTQTTQIDIDLSRATPGSPTNQVAIVRVNGTEGPDQITLRGSGDTLEVKGLAATVSVWGAEIALDELVVDARGSADVVDASAVQAGAMNLTLDGGAGDDTLTGGQGNDLLIGGQGTDALFGGPGDDTFAWNPGDASDIVEGQVGQDSLVFNGANIAEVVELAAAGERLRFSRNVGTVDLSCDGIELVQFHARGGEDTITVGDLAGTAVAQVNIDLALNPGSSNGDLAADTVFVDGTEGPDAIHVAGTGSGVNIVGLTASVSIVGAEPSLDRLILRGQGGDDVLEAADLESSLIELSLLGGLGNDILIGGAGADLLFGGPEDDVLIGGPGQDVLDGGSGSNVLIQD